MKLYDLLKVCTMDTECGYITVMTERGSAVCYDCGPAFVAHRFKDRDVVRVEPCIRLGKKDQTAYAGIVIIVKE